MRAFTALHIRWRHGYTLMEMLVTLTVIASIAVLVGPALTDDSQLRLMAASSILTSDIEYAQAASISEPDDPIVLRFVPARNTYFLAALSDLETPINRPDTGEPYLVTFGTGRAASADGVVLDLVDMPTSMIQFDGHGAVADALDNPVVELEINETIVSVVVSYATGLVSEVAGSTQVAESKVIEGKAEEKSDVPLKR